MFNLKKEIKIWKNSLKKHQGFEEGYIEELESHLIDNIDELKSGGINERDAFKQSVSKLGLSEKISSDYNKTNLRGILSMTGANNKWMPLLLSSYIKLGIRNILKHKIYSFVNIAGLALGLTVLILMGLVIRDELAFDQFNTKKDRIHRVYTKALRNGQIFNMAPVALPFAPAATAEFSEIEKSVRIKFSGKVVKKGDKKFHERVGFADPDLFNIFSFNLLAGDKNNLLREPYSVVLSSSYAKKYFGDEDPVGQTLLLHNEPFTVSGVFEDIPFLSHINEDIFISFSTYEKEKNNYAANWSNTGNDYTYLLLRENVNPTDLQKKFPAIVKKYVNEDQSIKTQYKLQSLNDIHFSNLNYDFAETTPEILIYVFGAICVFILLIACVNFINLATARATERAKEVGLRKVTGAKRSQLVRQFLIECIVIAFISLLFALVLAKILLPAVNSITRKMIEFSSIFTIEGVLILLGLVVFTGLLAGLYPALALSKYDPAKVLKSGIIQNVKGVKLRAILVVSQFVISIILIIGNFTMLDQINFMKNKDLGFKSKDLVTVRVNDPALLKNIESFRENLINSEYFFNATISSGTPFSGSNSTSNFSARTAEPGNDVYLQVLNIDENFCDTYKILLTDGRYFNKEISTDSDNSCLINQAAAKRFGWTNALNQELKFGGGDNYYKVIGVVKDFHYSSLQNEINPAIYFMNNNYPYFLTAHYNPNYKEEAIKFLKERYESIASLYPLSYFHIESAKGGNYNMETNIMNFLIICTVMALFVSSLGILGLVSFTVNKKRKELGIRKILGATVSQLFKNIAKEFLKWIIISNIMAWPIAYLLMSQWLQNYSYRIDFNYLTLILAGSITLIITFLTISYQAIIAAKENPVKSLRYE